MIRPCSRNRVILIVDVNDNRPRPLGLPSLGAAGARPDLHVVVVVVDVAAAVVDATFVVLFLCHSEGRRRRPIPVM
jgi:hypothetical protein